MNFDNSNRKLRFGYLELQSQAEQKYRNKDYEAAYSLYLACMKSVPYDFLSYKRICNIYEETEAEVGCFNDLVELKENYLRYVGKKRPIFNQKNIAGILGKLAMKANLKSNITLKDSLNFLGQKRKEENKDRPTVVILTCIWQRRDLTEVFLSYYKRLVSELEADIDLKLLAVGSEGEESKELVEKYGFIYLEHSNSPLNKKWEAGLKKTKGLNPDAVIILGSDDFLPVKVFDIYRSWIDRGVLCGGFTDGYFVDISNPIESIYWGGYGGMEKNAGMPWRINETMGMGRFYSSDLLEIINYSLWEGEDINRGLDGRAKERVISFGLLPVNDANTLIYKEGGTVYRLGQVGISLKENNIYAVDIKIPNSSVTPLVNFYRSLNSVKKISNSLKNVEKEFGYRLYSEFKVLNRKYKSNDFDDSAGLLKSTPSLDELFEFIYLQLDMMFKRSDHGLAPGEKGRLYGWYWGYYGRVLIDLYRASGERRFDDLFLNTCYRLLDERDDNLGLIDEERGRVVASWGGKFKNNKRANEITTAGLITLPMSEYASLFGNNLIGNQAIITLSEFLGEEEKASFGSYFTHKSDEVVEAINHANLYAASLAHASKLEQAPCVFRRLALDIYNYYKYFLTKSESGLVKWPYSPSPSDNPHKMKAEAIWKAGASIELPVALSEAGLIKNSDPILQDLSSMLIHNKIFNEGGLPHFIDDDSNISITERHDGTSLPGFIPSWVQLNDLNLIIKIINVVSRNSPKFPNGWLGEQYPNKGGSRAMIMALAHLRLHYPHLFS